MTEDRSEFMIEILKRLQSGQARLEEKVDGLTVELRGVKQHMAAFMQTEFQQDSEVAALKLRLERIERRLEING